MSKVTPDGRALTTKETIKQGPLRSDWFCAVADGHGANGHFVSQFIAQQMPKQFEADKKRIDRQKQAKDLVSNFKMGANRSSDHSDSNVTPRSQAQMDANLNGSEDRRIRKALISSFLAVQQKLEK